MVYAGFAGTQTATANLEPTVIYVIFWVGIPFASARVRRRLRAVQPVARDRARAWRGSPARVSGGRLPAPLAYPAWLGRWPAAAGILAFAWVELVYDKPRRPEHPRDPRAALRRDQLVGMSVYGIETWTRHADAFAVYFDLFSKLAPLHWRGRDACTCALPLAGATAPRPSMPGTVALLCTMIGTTSFDGFSQGQLWTGTNGIAPRRSRGASSTSASRRRRRSRSRFTVGLLFMVCFVGGLYRLGIAGMRSIGGGHDQRELARTFVHSLIPIALAYVVAHYFSLLAYQGQAMASWSPTRSATGSDIFGTASSTIDYGVISATGIWYVQVAALVARARRGPRARPRPRARRLPSRRATRRARSTGCSP